MWTTLRHKAAQVSRRPQAVRSFHRATLVAAQDQKRALDEAQIQGAAAAASSAASKTTKAAPLPPSNSSSGAGVVALGVTVVAAGAAYAYYTNYMAPSAETAVPSSTSTTTHNSQSTTSSAVVEEEAAPAVEDKATPAGNRVVEIGMPAAMKHTSAAAGVETEHPANGHRVLMTVGGVPVDDTTETEAALTALKSQITDAAAEALLLTHPTLWTATSSTALSSSGSPLDELTPAQLQARVVQLAAELKDRTKWEALRLKEFLAMKEQETGNK
jgi:mitofilin